MLVVFGSMSGNVRRFVSRLNMESVEIVKGLKVEEPYVLVTYTAGMGQVPAKVTEFLKENHEFLMGVAASGNKNWGHAFAKAAIVIAENYKVPIIHQFELSGNEHDIITFTEKVGEIDALHRVKQ